MTNPIDQAIAAAKEKAAQAAVATTVPAAIPASAGTVGVPMVPTAGGALSAADMMQGSFAVDTFLKVTEDGMKIGDSSLIESPLRVSVDLADVFYYFAVRYGKNPPTYKKTVNRQVSLDGRAWTDVIADAGRVEGPAFKGEYRSADIPMVLLDAAKDLKGQPLQKDGAVGTRIGKSLSTTEWREWESMLRSAAKRGINVETDRIELLLTHRARSNAGGNKWGVVVFELKGAIHDEPENQAA